AISQAIKDANSFLNMVNDALTNATGVRIPAILATHQSSLQNYAGTTNSHLSDILNIDNSIQNDKDTITSSDGTITASQQSLAKLQAGPDPLDVQSQQLAIQKSLNALRDAQDNFADYTVRAPFDGVLAALNANVGDLLSNGFVAATVISKQQMANLTLNEVDIANVKLGEKATLTFDAVPDLTLTGTVVQMDTIGTVSQGVVSYGVQIALDAGDPAIKPGMTVTASIITTAHPDVLLVPNSAVKTQGSSSYVEMLDGVTASATGNGTQTVTTSATPRRQMVQVGLSNDTMTEITSGLKAGDLVITKTSNGAKTTTATSVSTGGFRIPGITGGGPRGG
ncbi:MAG TPA: HlyD family efflux transporter periplasmic adaptor subunit, partial [Candidatus Paceibacterota bacterium]|nr:HlyD family efflux transporter periplasmic adaptor subunit [Candidatus Paceibacterota bacterium]